MNELCDGIAWFYRERMGENVRECGCNDEGNACEKQLGWLVESWNCKGGCTAKLVLGDGCMCWLN